MAVEPRCPINVGGAMLACVELEGLTLGDCQSAETWGQYPCCGPHRSSCALDHLADQPACRDCVFAVSQDLTYCSDLGVDFSPCTGE